MKPQSLLFLLEGCVARYECVILLVYSGLPLGFQGSPLPPQKTSKDPRPPSTHHSLNIFSGSYRSAAQMINVMKPPSLLLRGHNTGMRDKRDGCLVVLIEEYESMYSRGAEVLGYFARPINYLKSHIQLTAP